MEVPLNNFRYLVSGEIKVDLRCFVLLLTFSSLWWYIVRNGLTKRTLVLLILKVMKSILKKRGL